MYIQPKSIITGATGFVGSHLADFLLEQGHAVHCLVRKSSNLRWLEGKNVVLHDVGLDSAAALRPILAEADYVFHIAGTIKAKTLDGYRAGNVRTTENLLEAAQGQANLKGFLVTSSLAASGIAPRGGTSRESDPMRPDGWYGQSKFEQEQLAQRFMDKLPIVIVRPPAVYGARDPETLAIFKAVRNGIRPRVGLWGQQRASIIHVRDLVRGMWQAVSNPTAQGKTYFLANPSAYTWLEITDLVGKLLGNFSLPVRIPKSLFYLVGGVGELLQRTFGMDVALDWERACRFTQPDWVCDPSRAMQDFGFAPEMGLETGFRQTADWYREMGWLRR